MILMPLDFAGMLTIIAVCFLVVWMLAHIRDPGAAAITNLPVIGNRLADAYRNFINGLIASLTAFMHSAEGDLATVIHTIIYYIETPFYAIRDTLQRGATVETAHYNAVSTRQTGDENATNHYVNQISARQTGDENATNHYVNQISARQTGDENAINHYVGQISARQTGDENQVNALNRSYETQFRGQAAAINADFQRTAERQTGDENAINSYVRSLNSRIDATATKAHDDLVATAHGLEGYANQAAGNAYTQAVSASSAIALPAIQTVATSLDTYLRDCGDPVCSGLLNQANITSALMKALEGAVIAEILAEVLQHPSEAASAFSTASQGILNLADDAIKTVM